MKVKIVKIKGAKNVDKIGQRAELLKWHVIDSCTRTIAEAQAIASVDGCDENYVLELIARTLLNYAKRSKHDE